MVIIWTNNYKCITEVEVVISKDGKISGEVEKLIKVSMPWAITTSMNRYRAYSLQFPEIDELKQEIAVLIMDALLVFDSKKSSWKTFLGMLLRNRVYDLAFTKRNAFQNAIIYNSEHKLLTGEEEHNDED